MRFAPYTPKPTVVHPRPHTRGRATPRSARHDAVARTSHAAAVTDVSHDADGFYVVRRTSAARALARYAPDERSVAEALAGCETAEEAKATAACCAVSAQTTEVADAVGTLGAWNAGAAGDQARLWCNCCFPETLRRELRIGFALLPGFVPGLRTAIVPSCQPCTVAITHPMPELKSASRRWMYRRGRPNPVAGILGRATATLASAGLSPRRLVTLEVRGRRSGRVISFPVVVADYDGEHYLVAMLGQRANWVRNVEAAGGAAVIRHARREAVNLEPVEPDARAPILRRYLELAPGARAHIPVDQRAPLSEFEGIAAEYPVFRITRPRGTEGREAA